MEAEQRNRKREHNQDVAPADVDQALITLADDSHHGISVIIPLAGSAHRERIRPVIECLCQQKGVDVEIIIVHPSNESPINGVDRRVRFVAVQPESSAQINISYLRNEGVHHSHGSLLFIYDADILLGRDDYLSDLLERFSGCCGVALCDPPRYSVLDIDQEKLVGELRHGTPLEDVVVPVEEFVMCYKHTLVSPPKLLFRRQGYRTYFAYAQESETLGPDTATDAFWHGNGWNGGLIVPRKYFDLVGGYCEKFIGWGHEDSDMRQKLARVMPVFRLLHNPSYAQYRVYHLEHERPASLFSFTERNNQIRQQRRALPLLTLLYEDTTGRSAYQSSLRKRHPWLIQ